MIFYKSLLHGVPRSGTTWLGEIINSSPNVKYAYQPLFSYALKGYLNESSSKSDINDFYIKLKETGDKFILQKNARKIGNLPMPLKYDITHILYKEVRYHNILSNILDKDKDIKSIFILRHPCAVINSWLNAPKEFRKDLNWNSRLEWRYAPLKNRGRLEEYNGYEKWKEASMIFLYLKDRYPDRVMIIRYDDLISDRNKVAKNIFNFLKLELSEQTLNFLNCNKKNDENKYSVNKTIFSDNKWKNSLDKFIVDEIYYDVDKTILSKYFNWD